MASMSDAIDEFKSDTHRRVAANLAQPRSARELARFLAIHDPHVADDAYSVEGVVDYLKDLEAEGLVLQLDASGDPKAIVDEVRASDAVPTLHKDKAKNFVARATKRRDRQEYLAEPQWVATQAFYDRVAADIPNAPPPLEGAALDAALAADKRLED